ncbi:CapA family protein [Actinomycetospora soli]|uniref:CapA family protein n=1 Tax=Actinomycetospora soli TaxID=2893887 RepID=UPI0035583783
MVGTLICGGDVNSQDWTRPCAARAGLSELLGDADRRLVNLEGPLCGTCGAGIDTQPSRTGPTPIPAMIDGLTAVGIDVVNTANNVTFPADAAIASLEVLDQSGIRHCGDEIDLDAAHVPALADLGGPSGCGPGLQLTSATALARGADVSRVACELRGRGRPRRQSPACGWSGSRR